ncbi:MAG: hypothetical protein ISN28_14025 [Ectothiorhodospiraceae bacterium AqS1]|nr:hypothetical protein [Ectothiorhodospiraceae bacterium AqS1]
MLKCEPYYLSELELSGYPWKRESGYWVSLVDYSRQNEILNPTGLSKGDMKFLSEEFERSRGMSFNQRTEETHQKDWIRGIQRPDSRMAYEDMIIEDHPHREEMIEDLASIGTRIVF